MKARFGIVRTRTRGLVMQLLLLLLAVGTSPVQLTAQTVDLCSVSEGSAGQFTQSTSCSELSHEMGDSNSERLPCIRSQADFTSDVPGEWTNSSRLIPLRGTPHKGMSATMQQRLMDMYSWRIFVALNWPVQRCLIHDKPHEGYETCASPTKTPDGSSTSCMWGAIQGLPLVSGQLGAASGNEPNQPSMARWMTWHDGCEILTPLDCPRNPDPRKLPPEECSKAPATLPTHLSVETLNDFEAMSVGPINGLSPALPSSTGPRLLSTPRLRKSSVTSFALVDQNRQKVYYQIVLDHPDFVKIADGISKMPFVLPYGGNPCADGPCDENYWLLGAIELKLAWKVLTPSEAASRRFIQEEAILEEGNQRVPARVGLVGMHIVHHTGDQTEWIWSTFEQVDNLSEHKRPDGTTANPSFNNPSCHGSECPPENCPPDAGQNSQITRVQPIDPHTQALNDRVQKIFRELGSVLQYYQLVGTQYVPYGVSPRQYLNSTGNSNWSNQLLRNAVIEPYVVQNPGCRKVQQVPADQLSCLGCHLTATVDSPGCYPRSAGSECAGHCKADCSFLARHAHLADIDR
jgi:hypothetical protein